MLLKNFLCFHLAKFRECAQRWHHVHLKLLFCLKLFFNLPHVNTEANPEKA